MRMLLLLAIGLGAFAQEPTPNFTIERRISDLKVGESACLGLGASISTSGSVWIIRKSEIKKCHGYWFVTPISRTSAGYEVTVKRGSTVAQEATDASFSRYPEIYIKAARVTWQ